MAHAHLAIVRWQRTSDQFLQGRYSREHTWQFDGGVIVPASPSPAVVPSPWSNPAHVDPEEAFVAALSSCHLLTFLWVASKAGVVVDAYEDHAEGFLAKNERGVPWIARVDLHPRIAFATPPTAEVVADLHRQAHEQCYIANSVRSEVRVLEPRPA